MINPLKEDFVKKDQYFSDARQLVKSNDFMRFQAEIDRKFQMVNRDQTIVSSRITEQATPLNVLAEAVEGLVKSVATTV